MPKLKGVRLSSDARVSRLHPLPEPASDPETCCNAVATIVLVSQDLGGPSSPHFTYTVFYCSRILWYAEILVWEPLLWRLPHTRSTSSYSYPYLNRNSARGVVRGFEVTWTPWQSFVCRTIFVVTNRDSAESLLEDLHLSAAFLVPWLSWPGTVILPIRHRRVPPFYSLAYYRNNVNHLLKILN